LLFDLAGREWANGRIAPVHFPPRPISNCGGTYPVFNREKENQWLAREAAIGFAQLESGQVVEVRSEKHFKELVRGKV
jgi:hypothetical protein